MSAQESIFAKAKRQGRGCPVCGGQTVMVVGIQARLLGENRQANGKALTRQRSYCQEHGEALFVDILAKLGLSL